MAENKKTRRGCLRVGLGLQAFTIDVDRTANLLDRVGRDNVRVASVLLGHSRLAREGVDCHRFGVDVGLGRPRDRPGSNVVIEFNLVATQDRVNDVTHGFLLYEAGFLLELCEQRAESGVF